MSMLAWQALAYMCTNNPVQNQAATPLAWPRGCCMAIMRRAHQSRLSIQGSFSAGPSCASVAPAHGAPFPNQKSMSATGRRCKGRNTSDARSTTHAN